MVLKGPEAPHEGNVLMKIAPIVLCSSGFERLSFYTLTGSLTVFFSRELSMTSVFAQQMQAVFQSIVYMVPILGAFIADQWAGRFLVSSTALALSAIGAAGIAIGDATDTAWLCLLSLFVLYATPIAMVKPNLIVLGADQFNENVADQRMQRDKFFGAYYWITNIAAATAFLVMNQIATEGMGAVKKDWSFTFVFGMGTGFICCSFAALTLGSKKLYAPRPTGSPLVKFSGVTQQALKGAPLKNGFLVLGGVASLFAAVIASIPSFFFDVPALDYTLAAIIVIACLLLIVFGRSSEWVRHATVSSPGMYDEKDIEGAYDVWRLTPYIAFAIPFWSVYNQMNTSFISQGCQLNNRMGDMTISPAVLPTFNSIVIIFVIPIFNYGLYPCMSKIGGKGKFTMTPLRRIGTGFFFAAFAMLIAAVLEYIRRDQDILMTECDADAVNLGWCTSDQMGDMVNELSSCYEYTGEGASELVPKRDLGIMWQVATYGCVGLAETLVAITLYDFFYSQVPPYMRSVCQAIQMMTTSLGTMVGAVINNLCKSWLPNNLDEGNQEYMYFVNMGFGLFMLAIFIIVSQGFVYKPGTSLIPGDDLQVDTKQEMHEEMAKAESNSSETYSSSYSEEV